MHGIRARLIPIFGLAIVGPPFLCHPRCRHSTLECPIFIEGMNCYLGLGQKITFPRLYFLLNKRKKIRGRNIKGGRAHFYIISYCASGKEDLPARL